jgi:uncharacterized membrane protein YkvA (DUF1232 family)
MSGWQLAALGAGAVVLVYLAFVAALVIAGRNTAAKALLRFIPDCLVLFRRLLADPRVSRRRKLLLAALVAYLAMPLDLVPDFIPIAGQLDDALIVALVLRTLLRGGGESLLREHWPGPTESLKVVLRLAYSSRRDPRQPLAPLRRVLSGRRR